MYDGPERRMYQRREQDLRNAKLMDLLKKEVEILEEMTTKPPPMWVARRVNDNKILAMSFNRLDIHNYLKPLCQYYNISNETTEMTRGHYRTKGVPEDFEFVIQKFKIQSNVPQCEV